MSREFIEEVQTSSAPTTPRVIEDVEASEGACTPWMAVRCGAPERKEGPTELCVHQESEVAGSRDGGPDFSFRTKNSGLVIPLQGDATEELESLDESGTLELKNLGFVAPTKKKIHVFSNTPYEQKSPVNSLPAPTRRNTPEAQTTPVPLWETLPPTCLYTDGSEGCTFRPSRTDLKLCCRLIAMHGKSEESIQNTNSVHVFVDGRKHQLQFIMSATVGCNVNCLVFSKICDVENRMIRIAPGSNRKRDTMVPRNPKSIIGRKHFIFCFSWFNPKNFWDYASLGSNMLLKRGLCSERFLSRFSIEMSRKFLQIKEIRNVINSIIDDPKSAIITFTGFSLGSTLSHAMAHELYPELSAKNLLVRVIGFGGSRPGGVCLTEWCSKNLTKDSSNVMLIRPSGMKKEKGENEEPLSPEDASKEQLGFDVDPVCVMPSFSEGFDFQPGLLLLNQASGKLEPPDKKIKELLLGSDEEMSSRTVFMSAIRTGVPVPNNDSSTWESLHSVFRYYEALAESMERI